MTILEAALHCFAATAVGIVVVMLLQPVVSGIRQALVVRNIPGYSRRELNKMVRQYARLEKRRKA